MSDRCVTQKKHLFLEPLLFYGIQEGKAASQFALRLKGALSLVPWQDLCAQHLPLSCLPVQAIPSISIQSCRAAFSPDPPFVSPRYICLPDSLLRQSLHLLVSNRLLSFYDVSCLPTLYPSVCQLVPCSRSCCTQILLIVAPFPGVRYELYTPAASSLW